jgi:putative peptidoglycan lipid II flippase
MLIRSGLTVAALTFISRIFGMVRELFVAATFGTTPIADSVNIAFKLPNLFRRIFGEGALASVFVPIFSEKLVVSKSAAEQFASKIFLLLSVVVLAIIFTMQYFMPQLMIVLAPGFTADPDKFELTVLLCRITMVYLIFICLSSLIGGMMNSIGRFASYAASAIIMNIVIIAGTMFLNLYLTSYHAIAVSITLSGVLQLMFMLFFAYRAGLRIKIPQLSYHDPDISKLLKLMIPATITAGVVQINLFISQSIASYIPGAVSILSYADRLYQLPMSIVGVTFGTVLLPTLSKLYKTNALDAAHKTQDDAIKIGLFLTIPCSVALTILSVPIIQLIYEYGVFTHQDTLYTANALAAFAYGLPAFVLSKIFTPVFYAHQDAKTPMRITIYTIIANIILNLIFMQKYSFVGIALGSSIASWYSVYLFVKYAKKHGYFVLNRSLIVFIIKLFFCAFICSISMWFVFEFLEEMFSSNNILDRIIRVSGSLSVGFGLYIAAAFFAGILSKKMIMGLVRR